VRVACPVPRYTAERLERGVSHDVACPNGIEQQDYQIFGHYGHLIVTESIFMSCRMVRGFPSMQKLSAAIKAGVEKVLSLLQLF
jgi:hypothetical protein